MKLFISLSLLGGLFLLMPKTHAMEPFQVEGLAVNAGFHTEFYNSVQIDDSGSMRKFDYAPTLGFGASVPLDNAWRFLPELNWVLPRYAGSSRILRNLFMIRGDFGYDPLEWLRLRVGTSLMLLNQHGQGGSTSISNGNSSSTFYYPDENHSSINNTFDLGVEVMYEQWSLRLQTYTYSLFKEERRQVSYNLFLTYFWDL